MLICMTFFSVFLHVGHSCKLLTKNMGMLVINEDTLDVSMSIRWFWHRIHPGLFTWALWKKENTEWIRPQALLHTDTHTAPTHIMIVFNVPEAPSGEACWPPRQERLVCCFWDCKGQVSSSSRKLSYNRSKTSTLLGKKKSLRSGKRQGSEGQYSGGDEGWPSICQPVVERDRWSRGRNLGLVCS